ncbi:hypothetical protein ACIBI9_57875 [Nonomuraea sp. NPDC050451]|uniref:hypothetical protein n=1 Tax=Nonomuraea sp. NPDC050451 TaxID=3364364 RepID=UPI0037A1983C
MPLIEGLGGDQARERRKGERRSDEVQVGPPPAALVPAGGQLIGIPGVRDPVERFQTRPAELTPKTSPPRRHDRAETTIIAAILRRIKPAEHLHALGALRPDLPPAKAAEQIYVLASTENFEKLTEVCGWSEAEYEEWLASILAAALLEPPAGRLRRH